MHLPPDRILVGERVRRDAGDVQSLAASIGMVGMLQPVVVTPDFRLIAGWRRLAAAKLLKLDRVPIAIVQTALDATRLLVAERDENTCRKDFTPSEAVAIGERIEALEKPKAEERKQATQAKPGIGKAGGGKLPSPEPSSRKTRDAVGKAVGMSGKTFEKARAVVAAAAKDPAHRKLVERMDKTGKVDGAFKELKRHEQEAARPKVAAKQEYRVACCDFAALLARETPDLVLTDPPYPREFIPLYGKLAEACKAANVPVVAVMCGQSYLPEILAAMTPHLTYRWTLAYLTPGGQAVQQWQAKVNTFWKPVLLFGAPGEWIGDVTRSAVNDNDKRFHGWGQSETGMGDLVDRLSHPGQLVCDPFLGGGTTAVACVRMGRRFTGCDVDAQCVSETERRLAAL